MGGNFGGSEKLFLVHPRDIAAAAIEELLNVDFTGTSHRYVISDECTGQEIATMIGSAIGKNLKWVVFTDEQQKAGLLQAGLSETHAAGYAEMGHAMSNGSMQGDARAHKLVFSATKLQDFASEFAQAYSAKQ